MSTADKIRVAVLYGGRSGEHEVSLLSAANVIQYLDRNLFEVIPIGIDKQGAWYIGDNVLKLSATKSLSLQRAADKMLFKPDSLGKSQPIQANLLAATQKTDYHFDVVFPVIHGVFCEDGTVQGLLEMADIPYVGCGVLASAVGMDKDISKRLIANAGIAVAPYVVIKQRQWEKNPKDCLAKIAKQQLSFPLFVKPVNTGSSVGVEKVKEAKYLAEAIENAFHYDTKVIVEQGIDAIELEVAALETNSDDPFVSVVGEVRPNNHEFYSYSAKYLDENGADLLIPADLSKTKHDEVQQIAKQIFSILDCEGMARIDLFMERNTQKIYFNEINTIPGFTKISMYPKLMEASGISYAELLTRLVMCAIERHQRKTELCHEYQNHTQSRDHKGASMAHESMSGLMKNE